MDTVWIITDFDQRYRNVFSTLDSAKNWCQVAEKEKTLVFIQDEFSSDIIVEYQDEYLYCIFEQGVE